MEEIYWVIDNVNKTKMEALTWRQLLFWCSMSIRDYSHGRNPETGRYEYYWKSPNTHVAIENFFSDFAHNENDGIWRPGYYKREIDYIEMIEIIPPPKYKWQPKFHREIHYKNGDWVPPEFIPKRWTVIDSFDRIIPTSIIKNDYNKYIPCEEDKPPVKSRFKYRFFHRVDHSWEFRKGPVPGISKGNWNGRWHKYRGKHGHTIQELKQYHRDIIEREKIRKEYGLTLKINRSWFELDPWNHGHHKGTHGKGWKRSRKQKQWMKHGWKKIYKVEPAEI